MWNRYDDYFTDDSDGVHFEVNVDGRFVATHVARRLLLASCLPCEGAEQCLAAFRTLEPVIEQAVVRIARQRGAQCVVLDACSLHAALLSKAWPACVHGNDERRG